MKSYILLFIIVFYVLSQNNQLTIYTVEQSTGKGISGITVVLKELNIQKSSNYNGFIFFDQIPSGPITLSINENDSVYFEKKLHFSIAESKSEIVRIGKRKIFTFEKLEDKARPDRIFEEQELIASGVARRKSLKSAMNGMARYSISPAYPKQKNNTEEYRSYEENGFRDVLTEPLSTFSADVDRASYSNVRRILKQGNLPTPGAVRTEEFINYFNYNYEKPSLGIFSFFTEYGICPWNKDNKLLQIAVNTKEIPKNERKPGNFVFLLDVSGSMSSENKLPLLKKSLSMMLNELNKNDYVSIVVYAGAAGIVLEPTRATERTKIIQALEKLNAGGSTAGSQGIELAYKTAKENYIKHGNNRVILATDGDFNVGPSSESALVKLIEKKRKEGVFLTVLGFGMGNYKDSKMEMLADKGNGNYAYIDNLMEAKKNLVTEFGSTLETVAKDVKFQVEFNPKLVKSYRLVGYENRKLENKDFDNDKKDAGEVGAGHSVTILYEIVPANGKPGKILRYQDKKLRNSMELAFLKVRYKGPDSKKSRLIEKIVPHELSVKSSDNFLLASSAAAFALLLRKSDYNKTLNYQLLEAYSKKIKKDEMGYIGEFKQLVSLAKVIRKMESVTYND